MENKLIADIKSKKIATGEYDLSIFPADEMMDYDFKNIVFKDCVIKGGDFASGIFDHCIFHNAKFKGSALVGVRFNNCLFDGISFQDCQTSFSIN